MATNTRHRAFRTSPHCGHPLHSRTKRCAWECQRDRVARRWETIRMVAHVVMLLVLMVVCTWAGAA